MKAISTTRMAAANTKSIGDASIIPSGKVVVRAKLSPGDFTSPKKPVGIYMNPVCPSSKPFMATPKRPN